MIMSMFTDVRTLRQVAVKHTVSAMLVQAKGMLMTKVMTVHGSQLKNQDNLEHLDMQVLLEKMVNVVLLVGTDMMVLLVKMVDLVLLERTEMMVLLEKMVKMVLVDALVKTEMTVLLEKMDMMVLLAKMV